MGWEYNITADGTSLLNYAQVVVVRTEYGLSELVDADFIQPGAHGSIYIPNQLYGPGDVVIAAYLRETNSSGAVTHADGKPGHIYENLSILKRLLGKTHSLITLARSAPHQGSVRLLVKPGGQPSEGADRFQVIFPMRAPKPFWEKSTATGPSSLTSGNFNPGGDAPVDDMTLTFSGAGNVQNTTNGSGVEVTGATTLNCGARTSSNGPGLVIPNDDRWLHLEGGINNSLTVTGTVTITYRTKWK